MARHPDGRALIDFSKGSLTITTLKLTREAWVLDIPAQGKSYGGRGLPPPRSAWLVWGRDMVGAPPPSGWEFQAQEPPVLRLHSTSTGESLAVYPLVP